MDQLEPCPACQRHVRTSETGCPFCGADVADAMASAPTWIQPSRRLSRAALLALGMGAGVVAAGAQGCSDEDDPTAAEEASEELASEQAVAMPVYGLSPQPTEPPRKPMDAGAQRPLADAGAKDAGVDAGHAVTPPRRPPVRPPPSAGGGTIRPLYGAPIVRYDADEE